MADDVKSLEMRIAAIEDKLSKMHVTEEEMKAYEKVSGMMGGQGAVQGGAQAAICQICAIARNRAIFCWPGIRRPIITVCECQCGPCIEGGGGGGGFGGGFGGFGG